MTDVIVYADIKCQQTINRFRADRGPERKCERQVKYWVPSWNHWVCGVHARGYTKEALRRVRREVPEFGGRERD